MKLKTVLKFLVSTVIVNSSYQFSFDDLPKASATINNCPAYSVEYREGGEINIYFKSPSLELLAVDTIIKKTKAWGSNFVLKHVKFKRGEGRYTFRVDCEDFTGTVELGADRNLKLKNIYISPNLEYAPTKVEQIKRRTNINCQVALPYYAKVEEEIIEEPTISKKDLQAFITKYFYYYNVDAFFPADRDTLDVAPQPPAFKGNLYKILLDSGEESIISVSNDDIKLFEETIKSGEGHWFNIHVDVVESELGDIDEYEFIHF